MQYIRYVTSLENVITKSQMKIYIWKKSFSIVYLLMKLLMTVKTEAIKLRHTFWTRNYFLSSKKLFLRLQPRLSYFPLTLISALSVRYQELITTCMEFCSKLSSRNFPNNGSNYSELWKQTIRIVSFGCCVVVIELYCWINYFDGHSSVYYYRTI